MKPKRRLQREKPVMRTEFAVLDIRCVQVTAPCRDEEDAADGIVNLAASIARHGLLQPVLVRKSPQAGQYILVCGERRLRACRMAGVLLIPAMVMEGDEQEATCCWLEEHLTRSDPSFLLETDRLRRAGAERVRQRFALPQAMLDARMRMTALPSEVKALIRRHRFSLEQAQPLLEIADAGKQLEAAELIAQRELGAKQARRLVCGPDEDAAARRTSMSTAAAAIHETVRRLKRRGMDVQVGMHSQEEGVCFQIYLKNLRYIRRSAGNQAENAN